MSVDPAIVTQQFKGTLAELLGIRVVEASQERVVAELTIRDDLTTVGGSLHGGTLMAFADTMGAVATMLNLRPERGPRRSSRRPTSSPAPARASCARSRRRSIAASARWCGRRVLPTRPAGCSRSRSRPKWC